MTIKQHNTLTHFNRVMIFVLTVIGLLMDGPHHADLPSTLALIVWLWLPHCAQLEENVLKKLNTGLVKNPGLKFGEQ